MGVRGFPSFFFSNNKNQQEYIYGARAYPEFENKVMKLLPETKKSKYDNSSDSLFNSFSTLTAKEFSDLSGQDRECAEKYLENLCDTQLLQKIITKNGNIYFKK